MLELMEDLTSDWKIRGGEIEDRNVLNVMPKYVPATQKALPLSITFD